MTAQGIVCQCVTRGWKRVHVCSQCKPRVIVESPYAADTPEGLERNLAYARECLKDSLRRGEAPFLSHLLYTQVLDDRMPHERTLGIEAGLIWGHVADLTVVYTDLGISPGMQKGIDRAKEDGRRIRYRRLQLLNPAHFQETDRD
jgi:hypothetical protein